MFNRCLSVEYYVLRSCLSAVLIAAIAQMFLLRLLLTPPFLVSIVSSAEFQVSYISRYLAECSYRDRGAIHSNRGWVRELYERTQSSWSGAAAGRRVTFLHQHFPMENIVENGFGGRLSESGRTVSIFITGLYSSLYEAQRKNHEIKGRVNSMVRTIS